MKKYYIIRTGRITKPEVIGTITASVQKEAKIIAYRKHSKDIWEHGYQIAVISEAIYNKYIAKGILEA